MRRWAAWVFSAAIVGCGGGGDGAPIGGDASIVDAADAADAADASEATVEAASDASDADSPDARDAAPTVTTSVITTEHRFIAGPTGMFGGWGPHLGHLLRRATGDELWFADDACAQTGTTDVCDVSVDRRIDYFRRGSAGWTRIDSQPLPSGVQQNTGSLLARDVIHTFGVDTSASKLVDCTFDLSTGAKACDDLPLDVGPSANYVGAALAPSGSKVVWLTNVVDGGGGSFRWFVDYGGGWNGPRVGDVGGFNDAAYVAAAFDDDEAIFHAQFVSGLAPAWTFHAGVGATHVSTSDAVVWSTPFAPASADDPVFSTNDVVVDPLTRDAHLVLRTQKGAVVYYHRPHDGAWSAPLWSTQTSLRARLVFTADGTLHLVYGPAGRGLALRSAPRSVISTGKPVDWSATAEQTIALPAGYESIDAIYPEASIYQDAPVSALRVAVVGDARQNEVTLVAIDP